jgi:hypothetical protein
MKKILFAYFSMTILLFACQKEESLVDNGKFSEKELSNPQIILGDEPTNEHLQIGAVDNLYNCFGLAFTLCETGEKEIGDGYSFYNDYVQTGIFKENGLFPSKVLYWSDAIYYAAKDPTGITHAAMITDGDIVRSKEGLGGALYQNSINYYYLNPGVSYSYFRRYSLNMDLIMSNASPENGNIFTVRTNGSAPGVLYQWTCTPSNVIQFYGTPSGHLATFKIISDDYEQVTITLRATHQTEPTGDNSYSRSYPVELSSNKRFTVGTPPPPPPPALLANFTGSTSILVNGTGSWTATASGGISPYTYSWWLKRSDGSTGEAYMVGTGSKLFLMSVSAKSTTKQPIQTTNFDLYLKVWDSQNSIYQTSVHRITAYGNVNLVSMY